jgi:hypothetical protein
MDTTLFECETFRWNTIHRNLQVMEKCAHYTNSLFENDHCMRCDEGITEDQNHIWECVKTELESKDIYERAIELFHAANAASSIIPNRESANRTVLALGISPQTIVSSPLCRGIITMQFARKAKQLVTTIPGFKMSWLPLLTASITRAFWEIIWKPRTCQVQRIRADLETLEAEEERSFERQRAQARKSDIKERRVLQKELRKIKKDMLTRKSQRVLERKLSRKPIYKKKRKPKKKGNKLAQLRPTQEEEEEEIPIILTKKRKTSEISNPTTKKRKQSKDEYIEIPKPASERETPIRQKRKASPSQIITAQIAPKKLKTSHCQIETIPKTATQSDTSRTIRRSTRIQNKERATTPTSNPP